MHRRNSSTPWRSAGTCSPICILATTQSRLHSPGCTVPVAQPRLHSPGCMLAPWHGGNCSSRRAKRELQTKQPSAHRYDSRSRCPTLKPFDARQRALRHRQSYPIKSAAVRARVGAVPLGPTGSRRSLACRDIGHLRAIHRCSCQTVRPELHARPRAGISSGSGRECGTGRSLRSRARTAGTAGRRSRRRIRRRRAPSDCDTTDRTGA